MMLLKDLLVKLRQLRPIERFGGSDRHFALQSCRMPTEDHLFPFEEMCQHILDRPFSDNSWLAHLRGRQSGEELFQCASFDFDSFEKSIPGCWPGHDGLLVLFPITFQERLYDTANVNRILRFVLSLPDRSLMLQRLFSKFVGRKTSILEKGISFGRNPSPSRRSKSIPECIARRCPLWIQHPSLFA